MSEIHRLVHSEWSEVDEGVFACSAFNYVLEHSGDLPPFIQQRVAVLNLLGEDEDTPLGAWLWEWETVRRGQRVYYIVCTEDEWKQAWRDRPEACDGNEQ